MVFVSIPTGMFFFFEKKKKIVLCLNTNFQKEKKNKYEFNKATRPNYK